ncbi:Uncharacterised protein [Vibrio cholerae]|nr:Uncharacterised protein [Vibrio cholerae]CSA72022.1 Uncharacterised protein [Vibrio cholerae]CSA75154.1 Uncharacterised protein [Vibrio cholerae]CSB41581.1 Uncharacterised protein [Vibrio cholerae]CSC19716.1 Uncharacterised protein [Vibrio cholerae]
MVADFSGLADEFQIRQMSQKIFSNWGALADQHQSLKRFQALNQYRFITQAVIEYGDVMPL